MPTKRETLLLTLSSEELAILRALFGRLQELRLVNKRTTLNAWVVSAALRQGRVALRLDTVTPATNIAAPSKPYTLGKLSVLPVNALPPYPRLQDNEKMPPKTHQPPRIHFPYRLKPAQVAQIRLLYEEWRESLPPEERKRAKEYVFAEDFVSIGMVAFRMRYNLPTK